MILPNISNILQYACIGTSALNATYTIVLASFRHIAQDGRGITNTALEVIINLSGLVLSSLVNSQSSLINSGVAMSSFLLILRSYRKYIRGVKFRSVDLSGKVFIVTGSNTGLFQLIVVSVI